MSFTLKLLNFYLRWFEKPQLARIDTVAEARSRFETQARRSFKSPPDSKYVDDVLRHDGASVPVLWASPESPDRRSVLMYFHGGAYTIGSVHTHKALVARLAGMAGVRGVLAEYRLAPEHPFPSAPDDALTSYMALIEAGYSPDRIAIAGDSAGGGLALSLLGTLSLRGLPMPACLVAFSPWTDLTLSGASIRTNANTEVTLPAERMEEISGRYLAGADPSDPRASPLFGITAPVSPVLIQASRTEILLDDAVRMAEALERSGSDVELELWPNTPHVWQIFQGRLPEADQALDRAAAFLRKHLPKDDAKT